MHADTPSLVDCLSRAQRRLSKKYLIVFSWTRAARLWLEQLIDHLSRAAHLSLSRAARFSKNRSSLARSALERKLIV
jgi:hypothetical protein